MEPRDQRKRKRRSSVRRRRAQNESKRGGGSTYLAQNSENGGYERDGETHFSCERSEADGDGLERVVEVDGVSDSRKKSRKKASVELTSPNDRRLQMEMANSKSAIERVGICRHCFVLGRKRSQLTDSHRSLHPNPYVHDQTVEEGSHDGHREVEEGVGCQAA